MRPQAARRLYDELLALEREARDARRAAGEACSRREAEKVLRREPYEVILHAQRLSNWLHDDPAKRQVPHDTESGKIWALVRLWSAWAGKPPPDQKDRKRWNDLIEAAQPARMRGGKPDEPHEAGKPVSEWDPIDLGVHRAIGQGDSQAGPVDGGLPRYVRRGHDEQLREWLAGCDHPVMAVVVGGSSTGKTRACYEAVQAVPGQSGRLLACPADGAELSGLLAAGVASGCLLWLNEMQLFLDGDHGPAVAAGLRRLLTDDRRDVVVVGSMWPKYWRAFTTRPETGDVDKYAQVRGLLGLSRVCKIDVPDDFSGATAAERAELEAAAAEDPRLATAMKTAGPELKVVQVLAGGVVLLDRYEHILSPHSRALITVAMDARRLGHRQPLPAPLLEQAAAGYLTAAQRAADSGWVSDALADAAEAVMGIRALEPSRTAPGVGPPDGYALHDYLDQHGRSMRRRAPLPGSAWDALASRAVSADDCNALSAAAEHRFLYRHAVRLATRGAKAGSTDCMCRLGNRFLMAGYEQDGERWLRQAIGAGSGWAVGRLVKWLKSAGREDEMEAIVRDAAERGQGQSTAELVIRLQDTGRDSEAAAWAERLHQAAGTGNRDALFWWWALLGWSQDRDYEKSWSLGRHEESPWSRGQNYDDWLLRAAAADIPEAIVTMRDEGTWRKDDPAVEPVLRQAADRGDTLALDMLHGLLVRKGRAAETQPMWARAAQKGSAYAMRVLAQILLSEGNDTSASEWVHRAARAGDANAMCVWAGWLARSHHDEEAEHWLRKAAEHKNDAAESLGDMWVGDTEDREAARQALAVMAEIGDSQRLPLLIKINPSSRLAAERWRREVAEAGSTMAMRAVIRSFSDGRRAETEEWLRHLIEAGVPDPRFTESELSDLLSDSGRHQEAQTLTRFGIEPGGHTAAPWAPETVSK